MNDAGVACYCSNVFSTSSPCWMMPCSRSLRPSCSVSSLVGISPSCSSQSMNSEATSVRSNVPPSSSLVCSRLFSVFINLQRDRTDSSWWLCFSPLCSRQWGCGSCWERAPNCIQTRLHFRESNRLCSNDKNCHVICFLLTFQSYMTQPCKSKS